MSYMYDATSLGQFGAEVITDTAARTSKDYSAITVLADATFSTLTGVSITGNAITGFAIPAGITLLGRFTAVTLTSGKVIAYNNGVK
jgi:hypothetical protein